MTHWTFYATPEELVVVHKHTEAMRLIRVRLIKMEAVKAKVDKIRNRSIQRRKQVERIIAKGDK